MQYVRRRRKKKFYNSKSKASSDLPISYLRNGDDCMQKNSKLEYLKRGQEFSFLFIFATLRIPFGWLVFSFLCVRSFRKKFLAKRNKENELEKGTQNHRESKSYEK